jgi:hypothetical protein
MNAHSACRAKLGNSLIGNRAFAMDTPKSEGTMRALLRGYPDVLAELNDLVGPVHVFADAASRDAACQRFNPGVFELRPVSTDHVEYVCKKMTSTVKFAIGPALHSATFAVVVDMVIPVQVRSLRLIGKTRRFVIEIDQVEYRVAMDERNRVDISIDNRLGRRRITEVVDTRDWLATKLATLFRPPETTVMNSESGSRGESVLVPSLRLQTHLFGRAR